MLILHNRLERFLSSDRLALCAADGLEMVFYPTLEGPSTLLPVGHTVYEQILCCGRIANQ